MFKDEQILQLAHEFNLQIHGKTDIEITTIGTIEKHSKNSILWAKNNKNLTRINSGYVVVNEKDLPKNLAPTITYLVTKENPRLIYAKIISRYFNHSVEEDFENFVEEHRKNPNIRIGTNVFIGKDVEIGDDTVIHHNVVIHARTKIGKNCLLKTHVSIGTEGLGLEMDKETDLLFKFPQLGSVILEDNVEIGPTSTVRRGAIDYTIIKRGSKIGALVNIGHNCIIGENCILTCMNVTGGSSVLGDRVFMGVNSVIKNGVVIGNDATIGQGAIVTKDVEEGITVIGNPAESISSYKRWAALKEKLLKQFK